MRGNRDTRAHCAALIGEMPAYEPKHVVAKASIIRSASSILPASLLDVTKVQTQTDEVHCADDRDRDERKNVEPDRPTGRKRRIDVVYGETPLRKRFEDTKKSRACGHSHAGSNHELKKKCGA